MLEGQRQDFSSNTAFPVLLLSNSSSPSPMGRRDGEKDQSFPQLPGFTTASSGAGGVQGWPELIPVAAVPQEAGGREKLALKSSHTKTAKQ